MAAEWEVTLAGSSQATAITSARSRGGKDPGAVWPGSILQGEALDGPSSTPLVHPRRTLAQSLSSLRVAQAGLAGEQQDQPCPLYLGMAPTVLPSDSTSLTDLFSRESGLAFMRVTPVPPSAETGRMR